MYRKFLKLDGFSYKILHKTIRFNNISNSSQNRTDCYHQRERKRVVKKMREKSRLDSARSHGASPKKKSCDQSVRDGKNAILQMRKSENRDCDDFKSRVKKPRTLSILCAICFRLNFIFHIQAFFLRTPFFAKNSFHRKRKVCPIKSFFVERRRK